MIPIGSGPDEGLDPRAVARARKCGEEASGSGLRVLAAAEPDERVDRDDLALLSERASTEATGVGVARGEGLLGIGSELGLGASHERGLGCRIGLEIGGGGRGCGRSR